MSPFLRIRPRRGRITLKTLSPITVMVAKTTSKTHQLMMVMVVHSLKSFNIFFFLFFFLSGQCNDLPFIFYVLDQMCF